MQIVNDHQPEIIAAISVYQLVRFMSLFRLPKKKVEISKQQNILSLLTSYMKF